MQSDLHKTSYWPKLTEILTSLELGEYKKNRTDMYQILLPYIDTAIANAEKLDKINSGKLPSASVPGTKVYEIIKKLKPYLLSKSIFLLHNPLISLIINSLIFYQIKEGKR